MMHISGRDWKSDTLIERQEAHPLGGDRFGDAEFQLTTGKVMMSSQKPTPSHRKMRRWFNDVFNGTKIDRMF